MDTYVGNINQNFILILATAFLLQTLFIGYILSFFRGERRDSIALHKELFGLVRKLEGMTSSRRETMLRHYDRVIDELAARLPMTVANQAGKAIFETESRILARLAELEPGLENDETAKSKMNELISSMEKLESTLVSLTSETVQNILLENRQNFLREGALEEIAH